MIKNKQWSITGYIKNMESIYFDKIPTNSKADILFHNRVNTKWKPSNKVYVTAELRNRIFWGETPKTNPAFVEQIKNENEKINLQKVWVINKSLILHTNIDRLNIKYEETNWNLKLGRQRINWGMTTTWNPNDIFNSYNFLDFDYEERPGMDGSRFQYIFNSSFNVEIAYANSGHIDGNVAAIKYNLNQWGYDMQFITGWYKQYFTLGTGWAGQIKNAGFKGEVQCFFHRNELKNLTNLSLEADYMFKGGWYVNIGLLYNENGLYKTVSDWNKVNLKLSPENIMPTRWNIMATSTKEITPLLSANITMLYAPGTHLFFLLPSLKINLATNIDADLIGQSFFTELNNKFEAMNHQVYLRLKWSF